MIFFRTILLIYLLPAVCCSQRSFVDYLPEESTICTNGNQCYLSLTFSIAHGYHIQANEPVEDQFIPSVIQIEQSQGVTTCQINYPEPSTLNLDESLQLLIYKGKLIIDVELEVRGQMDSPDIRLQGKLFYQVCDKRKCFFPRTVDFALTLD